MIQSTFSQAIFNIYRVSRIIIKRDEKFSLKDVKRLLVKLKARRLSNSNFLKMSHSSKKRRRRRIILKKKEKRFNVPPSPDSKCDKFFHYHCLLLKKKQTYRFGVARKSFHEKANLRREKESFICLEMLREEKNGLLTHHATVLLI